MDYGNNYNSLNSGFTLKANGLIEELKKSNESDNIVFMDNESNEYYLDTIAYHNKTIILNLKRLGREDLDTPFLFNKEDIIS